VQLYPRYEQQPPQPQAASQRLLGYTAANIVEVQVQNLDRLGQILDTAVQAGGNTIEGIRFEVSNSQQILDQARETAMEEARRKAEQLVSLAGAELGEVLTITDTSRTPRPVVSQERLEAVSAVVPIEPGTQTVEVDVQVTWLLR
jgi:uncharacterized protein YggE